MSNNIIEALRGLAKFEKHEIEGLCSVNILKPTIAAAEEMENLTQTEDDGINQIKAIVKEIGLKYIVDDEGENMFSEETIDSLLNAPLEVLTSIIKAFKETFEKANSLEEIEKKH